MEIIQCTKLKVKALHITNQEDTAKAVVLVAQLCLTLCDSMEPARLFCPWDFPGKSTGVVCHALFRGSS